MRRWLLLGSVLLVLLLMGGAGLLSYHFAPTYFANALIAFADATEAALPGWSAEAPPSGHETPKPKNPAFFEAQTSQAALLQRLAQFIPREDPGQPDADLIRQFERTESGWLAKTLQGSWKSDDAEPTDGLAVSASGTVVALAYGERCRLFDIEASAEAANGLRIRPRAEPAFIELPGRSGEELRLDREGDQIVYLSEGGVVHAADVLAGTAGPIDADRLVQCTLLNSGPGASWMVAGTQQGDIFLFDLQGTILQISGLPEADRGIMSGLRSIGCDPDGQIVVAGYDSGQFYWFRRQEDQLVYDGKLSGFSGAVQSVAAGRRHFAVAGEHYRYACLIPEPGESPTFQATSAVPTTHRQAQIALAEDEFSTYITMWGETSHIRSDTRTVWLYAVDTATGHADRPFRARLPEAIRLRRLSSSGTLMAAESNGVLVVAQPPGIDSLPPEPFIDLIGRLLADNHYDELDRCTHYLGDAERRLPQIQTGWIDCINAALLPEDGDFRPREKRLLEWLDADPHSLTAWMALAKHYAVVAGTARGGGWASEVDHFGWEIMERDTPKADRIVRTLLAASYNEPSLLDLAAGLTGTAGWSPGEKKELGERAITHLPRHVALHSKLAHYRLPRWGGRPSEAGQHIAMAAEAIEEESRDAFYALLTVELLKYFPPQRSLTKVPVDEDRMFRGLARPHEEPYSAAAALYTLSQYAAREPNKIDTAAYFFDRALDEQPRLPWEVPPPSFTVLSNWLRANYPSYLAEKAKAEAAALEGEGEGEDGDDDDDDDDEVEREAEVTNEPAAES